TLAQLRADAFCDVLAGIPFQLIPGTDPITARADAAACHHPDLVRPVPDWPTESRFPNRRTGDADGGPNPGTGPDDGAGPDDGGGPDGGAGFDGGGGRPGTGGPGAGCGRVPEPPVPPEDEPTRVIDLYDY